MTITEYQSAVALIQQEGITLRSKPVGPNDVLLIAETATKQYRFEKRDEVNRWWADYTPLTNQQVQDLLQLALRTYHYHANSCYKAGAYLASCIMLGAGVEAVIIAVTNYLYNQAVNTTSAPKKGKKTRYLLDWRFSDLLNVAMELKWLPEELTLLDKLDHRPVKGPVKTDSIREVRNLVHPARALQDRVGKEYTEEELVILYATCHAVYGYVQDMLINHIRKFDPSYEGPHVN
jgi:hypothetical protein